MIQYIKGDLIKAFDERGISILLHQCNCVSGTRVSGFAKALQNKYPHIDDALNSEHEFGKVLYTKVGDNVIANCFSQYYPGPPNNRMFKYKGLEIVDSYNNRISMLKRCLKFIVDDYITEGDVVAMPLLASGLAKDKTKDYMSDLDYFIKYIAPVVENCFKPWKDLELNVYYL